MQGPSGNQLVLFSLDIRTLGKTKLFPLARDLTLRCIVFTTQKQNSTYIKYLIILQQALLATPHSDMHPLPCQSIFLNSRDTKEECENLHIIDKDDEIIMQYFINMHADTLVPVYVYKCKYLTVFVFVFQTVFKKLVDKLKYTIDLHRSKPVISLVPFNLHFHCFQG